MEIITQNIALLLASNENIAGFVSKIYHSEIPKVPAYPYIDLYLSSSESISSFSSLIYKNQLKCTINSKVFLDDLAQKCIETIISKAIIISGFMPIEMHYDRSITSCGKEGIIKHSMYFYFFIDNNYDKSKNN